MTLDVARGLYHMHKAAELPEPGDGIIHSALNVSSILIKDSGRAMISGFGHSKIIQDSQEIFTGDNFEFRYMAPELLLDEPTIMHGTDIWAMTTLEILTDVPAFGEKTKGPKIITFLSQGQHPVRSDHPKLEEYNHADKLWDLFVECWSEDTGSRPSAGQVVKSVMPIWQELNRETYKVGELEGLVSLDGMPGVANRTRPPAKPKNLPVPHSRVSPLGKPMLSGSPHGVFQQASLGGSTPTARLGQPLPYTSSNDITGHSAYNADSVGVVLGAAIGAMSLMFPSPSSCPSPEPSDISWPASPSAQASELGEPNKMLISSAMSIAEMIEVLEEHDCPNITDKINRSKCTQNPVAGGAYGDVYQGYLFDDQKVAIKCPRIFERDISALKKNSQSMRRAASEIYAASKLKHPNVLKVLGVAHFSDRLAIVSPWMENGSISDYLKNNADVDRCANCTQIATGLAYMHNEGTVHGDLRGGNILISPDGVAQIADFGNVIFKQNSLQFTGGGSAAGFSCRWTALEIVQGEACSKSSDVYALGMTILEIITGKVPFHHLPEPSVWGAVFAQKLPSQPQDCIPSDSQDGDRLWQLITQCLSREPTKRPTASKMEKMLATITKRGLSSLSPVGSPVVPEAGSVLSTPEVKAQRSASN